ncbi:hypothetical protein [Sphingorhabdus sp. YGSMI21]|uniref:hypothetical protein n=1 Tax=Sphingorhabdus sp. YGSMI21 TaxID=2077182 RepID=UPI000C5F91F1|nr:hypothetical protein [Sphingorhabdus sp. YGSMI21]ATW04425.1 hypothetical protein CHN51_13450 [Sphingorhabdus sp. YGSMI21]
MTKETGQGDPDEADGGGEKPRIDYKKILDRGKTLLGSTAWLSSLALIVAAISLTFLVYNDKICGIDRLGKDGIDKIQFRAPDSQCNSAPLAPDPVDRDPSRFRGDGGGIVAPVQPEVSALSLSRELKQIVAEVRESNGLTGDALLTTAARAEIEDRISENDLLADLREKARLREGLFVNYGTPRKTTVPGDPQPVGCQVYAKKKDAGKWLVIEGPNGNEIVRYANDSLPEEIGGRPVVTEVQVNGKDAVRLNIDLTGVEDNYTVVYAREASEVERNKRKC